MLSADQPPRLRARRYTPRSAPANISITLNGMAAQPEQIEHIWIITGPAGCGKTTVAQHLAKELSMPYVEGDDVSTYYCPCLTENKSN